MKVVFVFGRCGSGKTTASRFLAKYVQEHGQSVEVISGWSVLKEIFAREGMSIRFTASDKYEGFKTSDPSVIYEINTGVLQKVKRSYQEQRVDVLIAEYVWENYDEILAGYSTAILADAHVVYVYVPLLMCVERMRMREQSHDADRHTPPDDFIREHSTRQVLPSNLFVDDDHFQVVYNIDTVAQFETELVDFARRLL